ncbi:COMM domain-containing protein 2-like [Neocloeon triangulifer]|uniref:COMM domain-containing protein 2-like n=1 Tax=Neocloeon triangulifer TaxID=2078957 RepID=UPI00286ED584|nr:COMM domain-containing protein 2-like [Neocloeon triangulifer]
MLIKLRDNHEQHLKFFGGQPVEVLENFCQLTNKHLEKGTAAKAYTNAGSKLGVSPETVKNALEALIYLMVETSRYQVSEEELNVTLLALGFSEEHRQILFQHLQSNSVSKHDLRPLKLRTPHYVNLQWRLEALIMSRTQFQAAGECQVVIRLQLSSGSVCMSVSPDVLLHITETLESALAEANSRNSKKALRMAPLN